MKPRINPALLMLAQQQLSREKQAFQPPGGGMMDPAAAAGMPPGGAPMPPGGAPMPPGGAPPADPAAGGMAPPPMDPMTGLPAGAAAPAAPQQKMKPEQMMQMLDFRLYNMQQQMTALLNNLGIEVPAGALVMPPGQMSPTPEAAMPGGPQDPTQQAGPEGGGGGGSAIGPIEPMQGASPELAAGGGGGGGAPKAASADYQFISDASHLPDSFMRKNELSEFMKEANEQAPVGYRVALMKAGESEKADTKSTDGDVDEEGPQVSPPNKALNVQGAPATTPSLRPHPGNTAGGSQDPKSVTEGEMPAPKTAAQRFAESLVPPAAEISPSHVGEPVDCDVPQQKTASLWSQQPTSTNAAAVAAMLRSRTQADA